MEELKKFFETYHISISIIIAAVISALIIGHYIMEAAFYVGMS